MRGRALGALFFALSLAGCAPPLLITTKSEIRSNVLKVGDAVACADYQKVARYWDENAAKLSVDGQGASHLAMMPEDRRAEITVGKGPYFALMDLRDLGGSRTAMVSYVAGPYFRKPLKGWEEQLQQAFPCQNGPD